jgi:hypothetical protein
VYVYKRRRRALEAQDRLSEEEVEVRDLGKGVKGMSIGSVEVEVGILSGLGLGDWVWDVGWSSGCKELAVKRRPIVIPVPGLLSGFGDLISVEEGDQGSRAPNIEVEVEVEVGCWIGSAVIVIAVIA